MICPNLFSNSAQTETNIVFIITEGISSLHLFTLPSGNPEWVKVTLFFLSSLNVEEETPVDNSALYKNTQRILT